MDQTRIPRVARSGHRWLAGALAAAAVIGATGVAAGTNEVFLKIGDVKGESIDAKHPGEIKVLGWSWGVNGASGGDSRKTAVAACGQPLAIDKKYDRSSPVLATGAAIGTNYQGATLTVRKAGDKPLDFLVITLSGVTVKSTLAGAPDPEGDIAEHLVLGYASAKVEYRVQKPDGSLDTVPVVGIGASSCP